MRMKSPGINLRDGELDQCRNRLKESIRPEELLGTIRGVRGQGEVKTRGSPRLNTKAI